MRVRLGNLHNMRKIAVLVVLGGMGCFVGITNLPLLGIPPSALLNEPKTLQAAEAPKTTPTPLRLYVSPQGQDTWSGRLPEPNSDRTDGPLASLEAARDAIRRLRAQGPLPTGGVAVLLRGGTYYRDKTFELSAEDSGTAESPIVYQAMEGEEVRLVGGPAVSNWTPVQDRAVLDRLDPAGREKVVQADLRATGITDYGQPSGGGLELFFNDQPMTLARWPNQGFIKIEKVFDLQPVNVRGTKGDHVGRFVYEGDRPSRWADEKDGWVHGYWFWDWSDQRQRIASIEPENRILNIQPPYHHYGYRKGQWFYGYNLLCELDRPGEWYLDRQRGILYFWPPDRIDKGRAVVSVVDTLVVARKVHWVTFQGFILEAARRDAVVVEDSQRFRVAGCIVRNLGGTGIRISGGRECGVSGCEIYQTGGGGIAISGGDRKTLSPARHYALNNHIHHYGRWYRMYQAAVSLDGVGCRVAHNLMHDAPHQAIGFSGNDHLIEYNEIHHVCLESNDAGAIYAGRDWTMRGTMIRYNFMHHITGFQDKGCMGVYLDDMFCGTAIQGNVFYRVTRAAFIGGGRDCLVENNLFVDCSPAVHVDARALGWAAYSVPTTMMERLRAMPYQQPPWSERYPALVRILEEEPAAPRGNLIRRNVCVGGKWLSLDPKAKPYYQEEENLIDGDPPFVDPAKMDFRLRDDWPVFQKIPEFRRIPMDRIGLQRDAQGRRIPMEEDFSTYWTPYRQ